MTCSHRSLVPKARTPRTCVTVLASQPSVSMATETTQLLLVRQVFSLLAVTGAFNDLPTKTVNLVGCHAAEVIVQHIAGFKLSAVNQKCSGTGKRGAMLVEIPEQGQPAVFQSGRAVFIFPVET